MFPVSLNCTFCIATSFFSNIYSLFVNLLRLLWNSNLLNCLYIVSIFQNQIKDVLPISHRCQRTYTFNKIPQWQQPDSLNFNSIFSLQITLKMHGKDKVKSKSTNRIYSLRENWWAISRNISLHLKRL